MPTLISWSRVSQQSWPTPALRIMSESTRYDQMCRSLLKQHPVDLLRWFFRADKGDFEFYRWVDTRLVAPWESERYCDTIAHVIDLKRHGVPWGIPLEFQAYPDAEMFGRLLVYGGMMWTLEKPDP